MWSGGYKDRYDKPGTIIWSNFSIKILGINFDNFVQDNSNWDRIKDNIAKKNSYVEQSKTFSER